jgi:adenosylcobyric acid synthase
VKGGLIVCGASSDAGKSWVVAGLCRLLARRGVSVAPFKAQNMALNASVTGGGVEIGHAQWVQAVAAGAEPEAAMNPVLLKPTGERTSQVIVLGRSVGVRSAAQYQDDKPDLFAVVLDALADLRTRYDVVICEGAGSAAEINLLHCDITNLPLAAAAGLPAVVVGDIDRGGVFASLYGTVALLPHDLRATIGGFVVNRLRGDPALLADACDDLERRCGVPTLGVVPMVPGADLDAEDSLAVDRWETPGAGDGTGTGPGDDLLDVAVVRLPRMANFGDLDPLRLEPRVAVRWVRSRRDLGRPDLVVLPGSKSTVEDLAWLRRTGLADALATSEIPIVAVCAGLQMTGNHLHDPDGVEAAPGTTEGLGLLPVATRFEPGKVLDRPTGAVAGGPGAGGHFGGYRIHAGRIDPGAEATPWLRADTGEVLGWRTDRVLGTSLHALFEDDGLRAAVLGWAAERAGIAPPADPALCFEAARQARLDRIADALEAHLDLDALFALIEQGAAATTTFSSTSTPAAASTPVARPAPTGTTAPASAETVSRAATAGSSTPSPRVRVSAAGTSS